MRAGNGADESAIKRLPLMVKLSLLSETDKAYLRGYIDRALIATARKKRGARQGKTTTRQEE